MPGSSARESHEKSQIADHPGTVPGTRFPEPTVPFLPANALLEVNSLEQALESAYIGAILPTKEEPA